MARLAFRPHHFLCALGFQGKGYSSHFTTNFQQITDLLRGPQGDVVQIDVVFQTDSICQPCPHRREKKCTTQAKIERLDAAHALTLNLKSGDRLTWGEAKARIRQRISISKHMEICQGCEWLASGLCAQAILNLQNT